MVENFLSNNNIVFFITPKCGITWFNMFNDYFLNYKKKETLNVLIYRCPYKRIISYYLSGICNCNKGGNNNKNNNLFVYLIKSYNILYNYPDNNENRILDNISFSQFIDILIKINKDKLERHIRHQSYIFKKYSQNNINKIDLTKNNVKFNYILNTDSINEDVKPLLQYLNINDQEYNLFLENNSINNTINNTNNNTINNTINNTNNNNKLILDKPLYDYTIKEIQSLNGLPDNHYDLFLNEEIKSKIYNYYKEDFEWISNI